MKVHISSNGKYTKSDSSSSFNFSLKKNFFLKFSCGDDSVDLSLIEQMDELWKSNAMFQLWWVWILENTGLAYIYIYLIHCSYMVKYFYLCKESRCLAVYKETVYAYPSKIRFHMKSIRFSIGGVEDWHILASRFGDCTFKVCSAPLERSLPAATAWQKDH